MIFKALDIHSFGKLNNKKITFSDSLNVVYGTNESGKSTISAFMEAMLYSYPPRDTERKKYIPWDKDFSSGSLTLSHNGEDVTIFRRITASPSRDEVKLVPQMSISFIPPDRETYRKTIYCTEGKASDFGRTDAIEKKISNLILTGDENLSASLATEKLTAFRKTLRPKKGNGGKYGEAMGKIALLEKELFFAESLKNKKEKHEKELKRLEGELENITKERDFLISSPPSEIFTDEAWQKLPIWLILLYIICPLSFIITAFLVSKWFFVPFGVTLLFELMHLNFFNYKKRARKMLQTSEKNEYTAKLNAIAEKRLELMDEITEKKKSTDFSQSRSVSEIKNELDYYKNLLSSITRKLTAIDCAIDAINYAKEHISKNITPAVTKKAMEYVNLIAPKESRSIFLKEDLTLQLTDPMPQSVSSCSFGFREELYLAFRIALSEILYGKDMPLIFDDPFLGSDDFREKKLIDLFSSLSRDRQVIIFTNRQNPYYNQIECNFIDITG